jgi:plasmid stability protein
MIARREGKRMGQLIVRNVDDEIVRALKVRATQKRRSAEAEHREILREVLAPRRKGKTLKDLLLEIPTAGDDADFERPRDLGRKIAL